MKEDQEQSGGALVSSPNRSLTRNSGLIRRGLDLALLNEQSRIDSFDADVNERKAVKSEQSSGKFQLDNLNEADQVQQPKFESNVFDDETYAKLKPLFIAGMRHFYKAGMSMADAMRALVRYLSETLNAGRKALAELQPYAVKFMVEFKAGKIDPFEETAENMADDLTAVPEENPAYNPWTHLTRLAQDLQHPDEAEEMPAELSAPKVDPMFEPLIEPQKISSQDKNGLSKPPTLQEQEKRAEAMTQAYEAYQTGGKPVLKEFLAQQVAKRKLQNSAEGSETQK